MYIDVFYGRNFPSDPTGKRHKLIRFWNGALITVEWTSDNGHDVEESTCSLAS